MLTFLEIRAVTRGQTAANAAGLVSGPCKDKACAHASGLVWAIGQGLRASCCKQEARGSRPQRVACPERTLLFIAICWYLLVDVVVSVRQSHAFPW